MSIQTGTQLARRTDLRRYKSIIARRQRDFVEIGTALGLIRRDSLFKEDGFATFEEFVEQCCDMSRAHAYRLVDAARVLTILSPLETYAKKIRNEAQARQLVPLGKDGAAMCAVIDACGADVTAASLADARRTLYPQARVIDGELVDDAPGLAGPPPAIEAPPIVEAVRQAITDAGRARCEACRTPLDDGITAAAQTRCLPCDPDRAHFATSHGAPCATCTQNPPTADDDTGALVAEQSGSDSPADDQSSPEDSAVATTPGALPPVPAGEAPQTRDSAAAGAQPPAGPGEPAGEALEEGDSSLPSSSDPDAVVRLVRSWVEQADQIEADVLGPLLTTGQLTELLEAVDDLARWVGVVEGWRSR